MQMLPFEQSESERHSKTQKNIYDNRKIVKSLILFYFNSGQVDIRNTPLQHLNERCIHQPIPPPSVLVTVIESPFIVTSNVSPYVAVEIQLVLSTWVGQLQDEMPSTVTVVAEFTQPVFTYTVSQSSKNLYPNITFYPNDPNRHMEDYIYRNLLTTIYVVNNTIVNTSMCRAYVIPKMNICYAKPIS